MSLVVAISWPNLILEFLCFRKALSHDVEVQRLYEEMEQQIRNEKTKVLELVSIIYSMIYKQIFNASLLFK